MTKALDDPFERAKCIATSTNPSGSWSRTFFLKAVQGTGESHRSRVLRSMGPWQ